MVQRTISENLGKIKFGDIAVTKVNIADIVDRYHYHKVDCQSCTKAIKNGDSLEIRVDSNNVNATKGIPKVIHKYVDILLDKDIHEYVSDETGTRIDNDNKDSIKIILSGVVE